MIGTYNNEAISLLAIQSVLSCNSNLSISNVYLISPLLFDKKIRSYLKNQKTKVLSFQETAISKSDLFMGFNDKYKDSLVCTTNAIVMGIELGVFHLQGDKLIESTPFTYPDELGNRIIDIFSASKNVSKLLLEPTEIVYGLLRLEI
jgi:hypothetical protein